MCALRRLCRFARLCAFGGLCRLRRDYHCVAAITHAQRALPRHSRHYCTRGAEASPTATSLAKAIMIVDADQAPAEGQYLAEGDED